MVVIPKNPGNRIKLKVLTTGIKYIRLIVTDDSAAITSILFFTGNLGENVTTLGALFILILNAYAFKFIAALVDTPIAYGLVKVFRNYHEDPEGTPLYTNANVTSEDEQADKVTVKESL